MRVCENCARPVTKWERNCRPSDSNYSLHYYWVHEGGRQWCNPDDPTDITHAEPVLLDEWRT